MTNISTPPAPIAPASTTTTPPPSCGADDPRRLTSLLQSCLDHLESSKDDALSPVYFYAMAGLQEHISYHTMLLQKKVSKLQAQKRQYLDFQKEQQKRIVVDDDDDQYGIEVEAFEEEDEKKKEEEAPAARNHSSTIGDAPAKSTTKTAKSPSPSKPVQQSPKPAKSHISVSVKPDNTSTSTLTPLELQKKAAMEKRRQEVIEQRRQAAAEQRRIKEEERRKFLEYEQRKQDLKAQAAKEAELMRQKARLEEEIEIKRRAEVAAAFSNNAKSPKSPASTASSTGSPSSSANHKSTHDCTSNPPHAGTTASSSNATEQPSAGKHSSSSRGMGVPYLPTDPPRTGSTQTSSPPPSFGSSPPELAMPPHAPTGTDAKYRNMMSQQPIHSPPAAAPSSSASSPPTDTPQHVITALKHNVLLHWALVPPTYHVLKPIPQLLCEIHTVYPPALGVPGHEYFSSWTPIVWTELATQSAWDPDKLKKAVRKVRFFLHPDKLPRDLNDCQQFVCKLLWDVVNDAYEDFQKQQWH